MVPLSLIALYVAVTYHELAQHVTLVCYQAYIRNGGKCDLLEIPHHPQGARILLRSRRTGRRTNTWRAPRSNEPKTVFSFPLA